ncbi:MAG: DUF3293 domain-containing protein [Rhodanobacter sp.]
MDKALLEAFLSTDYLVCIDAAEWASIRIGQPLPAPLRVLVGQHDWGYLTAWNPRSQPRSATENAVAQRKLLDTLNAQPGARVHAAIGLGQSGWNEPSLFVIGVDVATLDTLGNRYQQNAYVHGRAEQPAQLRLLQS